MSRKWKSCGVILAGGRSSRMGRDKAELSLPDGKRFLEHAVDLLRGLPLTEVQVSGHRPGGIPDPVPGIGPLGGIYGVVRAVEADALLVLPVDMPLLRREILLQLLAAGERSGRACYFGNFYFPLWLPLDSAVREFLRAAVAGRGPDSIGALLRYAGAQQLMLPEYGQSFANINTPVDYAVNFRRQFHLESQSAVKAPAASAAHWPSDGNPDFVNQA